MLTEKDYCDYETCVALKEMGYKGMSRYYYTHRDHKLHYDTYNKFYTVRTADAMGYVLAIHLYEAQKFLREEKGIFVYIDVPWKTDGGLGWSHFCCNKPMAEEDKEVCFASGGFYDSYEEALSEGIKQSVKILKEK